MARLFNGSKAGNPEGLSRMKKLIKSVLRSAGLELRRVQPGRNDTMASALLKWAVSTEVSTVIDVGASNGCWTRLALKGWPNAQYLLVEAQRGPHEEGLTTLASENLRVQYVIAAAGPQNGTIFFDASDPFGGVASEVFTDGISVPVLALDNEVEKRNLRGPFLLKLDTHGFEVPILRGAPRILAESSLLVIESYNFDISPECLRFPQFCNHMEDLGFRCIDICDVLRRPGDGCLWQFDVFFVPKTRFEFTQNTYNTEAQMIAAVEQLGAGRAADEVAREFGVGRDTIHAWKAKYEKYRSKLGQRGRDPA
jgi:FkbM family methyltransferase